jgi:signal transduction histidine kinase
MKFQLKLSHKGLILVAVPLVFELVFVAILTYRLDAAERYAQELAQSRDVIREATGLREHIVDAARMLLVYNYTKNESVIHRFESIMSDFTEGVQRLRSKTRGNPRESRLAEEVAQRSRDVVGVFAAYRGHMNEPGVYSPNFTDFRLNKLPRGLEPFMVLIQKILDEEKNTQETKPIEEEHAKAQIKQWIIGFVVLSVPLTLGLLWLVMYGIIRRLDVLTDNAERLASKQPLNAQIGGVDEVARLDKVFHKMARALDRAETKKKEYVSMISHDLRTPLTAIQGTLELVERGSYGELSERGKQRVSEAEWESDRLISLINELLDIEKLEEGMLDLDRNDVALKPIVERASNSVHTLTERQKIKLDINVEDVTVNVDEGRILQVLINLLSNAVKFSPRESTIKITAKTLGNMVECQVQDQGPGISQQNLERIFGRFQQVDDGDQSASMDNSDGVKIRGSGLGLAICKALIEAHNGQIGVTSELGKGSTFWFKIPLAKKA